MDAVQVVTGPAPLILVVLLAVGAVMGFVAVCKSGKREAALDKKLADIANDAELPSAIRTLAAKAQGLELTKAAGDVKAEMAALKARMEELAGKIK